MKYLFYSFIAFLLVVIGCDNLVEEESNPYDYSIEQKMECFCTQAGYSWVKLYIVADTVASAVTIEDNRSLIYNEYRFYKSIKGLNDLVAETDTSTYVLYVNYDPEENYPAYIFIDLKPIVINDTTIVIVADDELAYTTRNYTKLN